MELVERLIARGNNNLGDLFSGDCDLMIESAIKHQEQEQRLEELEDANRIKELEQDHIDQAQRAEALEKLLAEISDMCIGEIAMGYRLDAQAIGEKIGLVIPELKTT